MVCLDLVGHPLLEQSALQREHLFFLIGFGVVVTSHGLPWWLAPVISAAMFAGSVEFILAGMLAATAPVTAIALTTFLINSRLRPSLRAAVENGARRAYIVNVSAMEGIFSRGTKTDKHPHTNMAKAALNMMTRTSAPDFVKDGIHMNAVDTGWVTDEDPIEIAQRKE